MDTSILEGIGLTNAEIKIYLALLELGSVTAGPIIEKSNLQSSVVHMTMNRLVEKGLVSFVKIGKKKHYQATDPKHILDFIDEKKEKFQDILPQLLIKQKMGKERQDTTVFSDVKGIKELLYELLDAGGTEHHTFGSSRESLMMGEAWWVNYHQKRAAKNIKAKLLFNESLASWKAEAKYLKAEVRYTNAGFEPLTETIIRNDKIGIILWTEKPIGILIHNKAAADSYDKFWDMLWKQAETQ